VTEQETAQLQPDPAAIRLSSRRDAVRDIANAARKNREEQIVVSTAEEPPPEETVEEAVEETVEEIAEPIEQEPELITFNVDGMERKVTVAEAQEMLESKAQADQEIAAQNARRQELEQMPPPPPDLLPLAQQAVSAILDSTEEEAAEKLVTVLDNLRPQTPSLDQNTIIEQAAERAADKAIRIEQDRNREQEINTFRSEREDIFKDPILYGGFDQYATAYHKEHPEAPPREVLEKAAESVDNWKSQFATPPPADMEFAEKEQRKARATENVSQISHRQQPPPEKKPLTHKEIIAQKQEKRGRHFY